MFLTGAGVVNNSGVVQSLNGGGQAAIILFDEATAGELTSFGGAGALLIFYESASAGSATFDVTSGGNFPGAHGLLG